MTTAPDQSEPLPELVSQEGDRRTELAQRVGGALLVLPGFLNSALALKESTPRICSHLTRCWARASRFRSCTRSIRCGASGTLMRSGSARHAAEFRNHWWEHVRETADPKNISSPPGVRPYPTKDMQISDVPAHDRGGNFGRLARVSGLMTDFIASAKAQEALGIPIIDWILFLRRHSDNSDPEQVTASLVQELSRATRAGSQTDAGRVLEHLEGLARLLAPGTLDSGY